MKSLQVISIQRSYHYCLNMCHQQKLIHHGKHKLLQFHNVYIQSCAAYHLKLNIGNFTPLFRNDLSNFTSSNSQTLPYSKNSYYSNSMSQFPKKYHNISPLAKNNYSTTTSQSSKKDSKLTYSHNTQNIISDRYIYVKTLMALYDDVPNGIVLDTAYGDSRPNIDYDPSLPVVVALHDTPGQHEDVVPLLTFFAKLGCRTICPTFPGHGNTRGIMRNFDDIFSQTTMERATFVHDFLTDLDVRRVDVLIGVGASSYTAMALCTRQAEMYKSMALLSPWPLTKPRFSLDSKMLERVVELWELVYFRPLARCLLPAFKLGKAIAPDEKIAACYLVQNIDFGEVESFALTASIKDIPRLVAYGGRDESVSEELNQDLLSKLGISSSQVISHHQQGRDQDVSGQAKALRFQDCDYDILTHQRGVLCAHLLHLLQRFYPNIKI